AGGSVAFAGPAAVGVVAGDAAIGGAACSAEAASRADNSKDGRHMAIPVIEGVVMTPAAQMNCLMSQ
ncbi:hypothetical protein, partial [Xanthomonas citri]|uniref:hypothetical protein n=1 Tax=Xanthomonas citri TaxID=346 RepID=UPI001A9CFBC9